jgi:hypothetical protein
MELEIECIKDTLTRGKLYVPWQEILDESSHGLTSSGFPRTGLVWVAREMSDRASKVIDPAAAELGRLCLPNSKAGDSVDGDV